MTIAVDLGRKATKRTKVLVQPRKTRPFITERLLMGRKESNQTNKITARYSEHNGSVSRVLHWGSKGY